MTGEGEKERDKEREARKRVEKEVRRKKRMQKNKKRNRRTRQKTNLRVELHRGVDVPVRRAQPRDEAPVGHDAVAREEVPVRRHVAAVEGGGGAVVGLCRGDVALELDPAVSQHGVEVGEDGAVAVGLAGARGEVLREFFFFFFLSF
jgi:hypothetical protein